MSAPLDGAVVALTDAPDPVFAEGLMGPGLALLPASTEGRTTVVAPVPGTVVAVAPHAVVVQTDHERAVLVHLGLHTVALRGQGFEVRVVVGDRVERGQPLATWDVAAVVAGGHSVLCPVVAVQAGRGDVVLRAEPGTHVSAGDDLFSWGAAPA